MEIGAPTTEDFGPAYSCPFVCGYSN